MIFRVWGWADTAVEPLAVGPAAAPAGLSAITRNGLAQKGHLIFLPARSALPLNFFWHSGQVMIVLVVSAMGLAVRGLRRALSHRISQPCGAQQGANPPV